VQKQRRKTIEQQKSHCSDIDISAQIQDSKKKNIKSKNNLILIKLNSSNYFNNEDDNNSLYLWKR